MHITLKHYLFFALSQSCISQEATHKIDLSRKKKMKINIYINLCDQILEVGFSLEKSRLLLYAATSHIFLPIFQSYWLDLIQHFNVFFSVPWWFCIFISSNVNFLYLKLIFLGSSFHIFWLSWALYFTSMFDFPSNECQIPSMSSSRQTDQTNIWFECNYKMIQVILV